MTARERARAAALNVEDPCAEYGCGLREAGVNRMVDAASDVWEPLLRDLILAVEASEANASDHFPADKERADQLVQAWYAIPTTLERAREALGPSPG